MITAFAMRVEQLMIGILRCDLNKVSKLLRQLELGILMSSFASSLFKMSLLNEFTLKKELSNSRTPLGASDACSTSAPMEIATWCMWPCLHVRRPQMFQRIKRRLAQWGHDREPTSSQPSLVSLTSTPRTAQYLRRLQVSLSSISSSKVLFVHFCFD